MSNNATQRNQQNTVEERRKTVINQKNNQKINK